MNREFMDALNAISKERGIRKELLIDACFLLIDRDS